MKKIFMFLAVIGLLTISAEYQKTFAQEPAADQTEQVAEATNAADEVVDPFAAAPDDKPIHQQLKKLFIDGGATFMSLVLLCLILGLAISISKIITLSIAQNNNTKLLNQIDNPWGFDNISRDNKDGVNINRDYDDFQTSEARAMRDYIAKFGNNLKIIIDSHNTNLDMPYIGTKETFRNYNLYARSAIQIAGAASTYLSTVYSADKKPYFYTWLTSNSDTLNVYGNERGKITVTIETPRNYSGGSTNNSEVTPLVQAIIANLIQIYGQANQ